MPSFSSTYWPPPAWIVPVLISRNTSPSAKISFSSAHRAGMWHALRVVMALLARHREAEGAGLHAVAHDVLHRLDLVVGGAGLLALVAHHVMAHRGVADQIADIDAEAFVELVHVLPGRLPIEIDGAQYVHRDRFDIGEEFGEPLLGALAHRRQRQRAIAEDHGRGAVLGREGAERIPGDLRVVMAVVVDKAGGDGAALGVDRARRPGRSICRSRRSCRP